MSSDKSRIAMWSGPRNISTALMRSFENRPDTQVIDEPLYSHYLKTTGLEHPGAREVMAAQESDWRLVVAELLGPVPDGVTIFYQKHMAHHLTDDVERGWILKLHNVFLIRDPLEMLTSLLEVLPAPTLLEVGLLQQLELFRMIQKETGAAPLVLDAKDVLQDPEGMLRSLCAELGLEFDARMLSWPKGRRPSDGVWAPWWYRRVEESTGFSPWRPKKRELPEEFSILLRDCQAIYDELYRHRLTASC